MLARRQQEPSLPPPHDRGPGILAEYYILCSIAIILLGGRIYVRTWLTKQWGWDDTTIAFACLFLIIGLVLIQITVDLGLGRHVMYLPNPERNALDVLKYNTFFQMDNVVVTLLTKISISVYILRIRDDSRLRLALVILMSFMTLATIAVIVVLGISCTPLKKLWEPDAPGTCLPLTTVYYVAYVQSGFTIVIDLFLTSAPVFILWKVRIQRGRKTFICFLMSLGIIATISNALRNAFQTELTSKDFTYDQLPVTVVPILEINSGVIAACIPTCIAIVRRRSQKTAQSNATPYASRTSRMRSGKLTPQLAHNGYAHDNASSLGDEDHQELLPMGRRCGIVSGTSNDTLGKGRGSVNVA